MLDTDRHDSRGRSQPTQRRGPEPDCTTSERSARHAECLRRADSVTKLEVELHLAVHDLRNSLSNAALNVGLLARKIGQLEHAAANTELLESVRRDLRQVQDSLHHVTELTGSEAPPTELIDVGLLLASVQRLARTAAQLTTEVHISVIAPKEPVFVQGSRSRLDQAVFALVRNAIQASGAGSEVRIEVEQQGGEVCIRVNDHGPGLPAELKERVFEEYQSTDPKSLGLGLCVARHIIAQHGGTLTLTSSPGSGVCAELRLPRSTGR